MLKNNDADKNLISDYVKKLNASNRTECKPLDLMSIEKVQEMTFDIMLTYSGNGYLLHDDLTQEYVNKFIEEWRRNNDC